MQLSRKLTLGFAAMAMSMIVVALAGFYGLQRSLHTYETVVAEYSGYDIAIGDVALEFKTQVQEWKNTLLRGKDPKALEKYWGSFTKTEADVAAKARKLQTALPEGEARALVAQFVQAHSKMAQGYRRGFDAFKAADFDPTAGDKSVAGMDREPSKLLEDASGKIAKDSHAIALEAEQQSTRATYLAIAMIVLVGVAGVAWGVWFSGSIMKLLGGEPVEATHLAHSIRDGDLTSAITLRTGDNHSLMFALTEMQSSLVRVVQSVRHGSEGVATASAEIASGNNDLSGRTESQASALEETASAMEELGATVQHNADNARQANQLAQSASTVAVRGGDVVTQVVDTMKGINDASRKISDIISVIDGIAFQTNILALNAAVEAARAGEQGRGFAVVASEVRSLAGRSAEAAKEIKSLISASVERVEQGASLVDQAGATMHEVVTAIRRVTDIMGEISSASQEQSSGVAQVGEAVTSLDQSTQQNAALVEQMAAAASSLNSQANELVQAVSVFKLGGVSYNRLPVNSAPKRLASSRNAPR